MNKKLSDEEVLQELARLKKSPYVRLGRKAIRSNKARQTLYAYRNLEKEGKKVAEILGITYETEAEDGEEENVLDGYSRQ